MRALTLSRNLLVTILCLAPSAFAQQRYEFNLATHPTSEVTLPVATGAVSVVIENRLPDRTYFYSILREWIPIPVLTKPADVKIAIGLGADVNCVALDTAFDAIAAPSDETQIPAAVKKFEALKSTNAFKMCPDGDPAKTQVQQAIDALKGTEILGPVDVQAGQQLRVTVQRIGADGTVEKTWTTVLSPGARGEWLTTYGLSFVPNDDQRFFSKPATEQGKFIITAERDREPHEVSYVPSVLFSWLPSNQRGSYVVFSPTAGFGATSDRFAVLVGGTATFNVNLGITAGVAFTNQQRLLGKYAENQVVSENLTEAQLHRSAKLPSPFFSVTFRFGQSPFASPPAAAPAPASPAPPATAAAPPAAAPPAAAAPAAVPAAAEGARAPVGGAAAAGNSPPSNAIPAQPERPTANQPGR